jgi:hypothetical protein
MQHYDGTIEETEPEGWLAKFPEPAEAPDDWSGSVDVNTEDLPGYHPPAFLDWQQQLEMMDDPEPD